MKYYIYISDSKVDMLLAQIPHDFKRRVALQFKVDLKVSWECPEQLRLKVKIVELPGLKLFVNLYVSTETWAL